MPEPGVFATVQNIPRIDLYRELEVDPAATTETIDAAWKSLVKRHHPDTAPDPADAVARMKRLNLAHEWLTDPRMRALYDVSRGRAPAITGDPNAPGLPTRPHVPLARPATRSWGATTMGSAAMAVGGGEPAVSVSPVRLNGPSLPRGLLSAAIVVVLLVGAVASVALGGHPPAGGAVPTDRPAAATGLGASSSGSATGSGTIDDPRLLAPPDLAKDIPASCRSASQTAAFHFSAQILGQPAVVYVAKCDAGHTYGPVVYVSGTAGWTLAGRGTLQAAFPYQGLAGPISGASLNEFGVAWVTPKDAIHSYLVLYRVTSRLTTIWDSRTHKLQWSLAQYAYNPAADTTAAGFLTIESADLTTGSCTTCHDHELYREFFQWQQSAGSSVGGLVMTSRQPMGTG